MSKLKKVENPVYQNIDDIKQTFWNNWLIITNKTDKPFGGIVLYYSENKCDEIWNILETLDQEPELNGYPDIMYVGPTRGFIGGVI